MKIARNMKFDDQESSSGFTIIELMIATLVFTTVLAMLTTGVIYFTNMYYKGINLSNTQRVARAITDNISQAIQFSGADVVMGSTLPVGPGPGSQYGGLTVLCVGAKRYTFVSGRMVTTDGQPTRVGDSAGYRGLFVDTVQSGCSTSTPAMTATNFQSQQDISSLGLKNASELIGSRIRLTHLSVEDKGTGIFEIKLSVAYGDNDLLTSTTGYNTRCRAATGSQHCATSQLTTTVVKRV